MAHKSDSSTQLKAEKVMLNMLEERFELNAGDLSSEKIKLSDKVSVEIDGYNEEHGIMIEVFARMGKLKAAHYEKIANDILKLVMVEKLHNREYRKILAVCGDEVERYLLGKSWKAHAVDIFNFEVIKVDIPFELKEEICAAQGRQSEGMK